MRWALNAPKYSSWAQYTFVAAEEAVTELVELEAALLSELAPVGALQAVLARRVAG